MTAIERTAYPRFKRSLTAKDLAEVYTPTPGERFLALRSTKGSVAELGFLVLLKTYQRLGRFIPLGEVPAPIIEYIAKLIDPHLDASDLDDYDSSGTRQRHIPLIRAVQKLKPYGPTARTCLLKAMVQAAKTKEDLADLINIALEELARECFELPPFATLDKAAHHVRAVTTRGLYRRVSQAIPQEARTTLDALFVVEDGARLSGWEQLKQEPASPTLMHLRDLIDHLFVISEQRKLLPPQLFADIAEGKVKQLAIEARALDATEMKDLEPHKRLTLAAAFVLVQSAGALDDLAEMFIKRMLAIHQKGKDALERYRVEHQARTDALVLTLRDLVKAYGKEGNSEERIAAMESVIGDKAAKILQDCEEHLAHVGNNTQQFLWPFYKSHRAQLFRLLSVMELRSSSQDCSLEEAIRFLKQHEGSRGDWLITATMQNPGTPEEQRTPLVDLSWASDTWWKFMTGQSKRGTCPDKVLRRHFEIAVFSQLLWDLKSGDLYVEGSDQYADYREQLISWEEYAEQLETYGTLVELPTDGKAFVAYLRDWLHARIQQTDEDFPSNQYLSFEKGELILHPLAKQADPEGLALLERIVAERLKPISILHTLMHTEQWLNWTRFFAPLSGHTSKLDDPVARYLAIAFCYGCNLGPSQTARSLGGVDRRDLSWVNQHHITEEKLDEAIRAVIAAYNRFQLPKYWGTGKRASADGTKWEMYEQNLLAEYHIRYGGYGGIGYYHVSDTYIALFSHFIPCGVWEGSYILDMFAKEDASIRPETVHGDTQAQSTTVFGLAHLLGISLMPRIRNWKDLTLYRPDPEVHYTHLDSLFTDTIDWDLIETHLPDMIRVALSIKAGKITPSTILRKLGAYSRKNKLYQAFQELGRVIRTHFLLHYLDDAELRSTIQAATNKSEAFNGFAKWAFFGGEGVITHNRRAEQRKCIKFNHLIANCLIFYNVQVISDVLYQLNQEGIEFDEQVVAALSPYLCQHINRFGRYQLDLTQPPPPLNYDIQVITKRSKKRTTTDMVAAISPKKAKPKRKKKNSVRQMKLL
jgi:TnpA family transposase